MKNKKRLFKDNKAVVPILVFVALVVIFFVAYLVVVSSQSSKYWETDMDTDIEDDDSMWKEEIIIEYADGTSESLKVTMDNLGNPLAVKYNGVAIVSIYYRFYADVDFGGYTNAELDTRGYILQLDITEGFGQDGDTVWSFTHGNWGIITLDRGITYIGGALVDVEEHMGDLPDGEYNIYFHSLGAMSYRGVPDGTWADDITLPPGRGFDVVIEDGGGAGTFVTIHMGSDVTIE